MDRPAEALALIEHVDRELDLACLLKLLLKRRHGIELTIANVYADAPLLLAGPAPPVVLTPFFYAAEDVVLRDYVKAWPQTRILNLAWEQVFYPSHQLIKAPRDKFTRKKVTHLAWSRTFTDYLEANGVFPDRIKLVGHAMYRLYGEPYRRYFAGREALARAFGLDPSKPWVFVPENYRWAFFTDSKLKKLGQRGPEADELETMRGYCRRSLRSLMEWCDALARSGEAEVILRPRPATSREELAKFSAEVFGDRTPAFRTLKDRSAREWVLACDVAASSYSTVLIEAALAGKAIVRVEPEPTPEGLRYDWCELAPPAHDEAGFLAACRARDAEGSVPLRDWAETQFFPAGDPVVQLLETVAEAVKQAAEAPFPPTTVRPSPGLPFWLRFIASALPPDPRHALFARHAPGYFFNRDTHEKDLFGAADVRARTARWAKLLGL
jgi:surface carbohydrate biosynthesis protein